jgi:carbon monoxide dehydrogenase subunit G
MIEVSAYAVVPAPPEKVWELVSDSSRYHEWVEGTEAVTRTDGPTRPGSTYDEVNPILGPWKAHTHWTVTEYEAPRRQVHRGTGLPLAAEFDVIFELVPEGDSTGFSQTLRGKPSMGPLGAAFAALMRGQVDRDNRKSVENLAELARREIGTAGTVA